MERLSWRPSPAMLVAMLALCIAIGGTAIAAVKLGRNAVKTRNIRNGAVTEAKLADGAVTEAKLANGAVTTAKIADGTVTGGKLGPGAVGEGNLAGSAKTIWVETTLGGSQTIHRQSGGVTVTPTTTNGETVVDFGTDVSNRAVSVTPLASLGEFGAEYARCTDFSCPTSANSPDAIMVFTFVSNTGALAKVGFAAQASP